MKKLYYSILALVMMTLTVTTFTSCDDVPQPYDSPFYNENGNGGEDDIEATGEGTQASPFNVAAALKKAKETGTTESEEVYVEGYITSISEIDTGNFGNATYIIADNKEGTNKFTIYRGMGLGNKKFTKSDEIKIGDKVIVYGKIVNFKGNTPEMTQGNYIYSLNGTTAGGNTDIKGEANGTGTKDDPFNVVAALQKAAETGTTETTEEYYVEGYITEISELNTSNFGNATFTIADDKEGSNKFTIYRCLSLGNKMFTKSDEIKKGDKVVVCGKIVNFRGNTPEITQGGYIYSINGTTADGGSTDTQGVASGSGTQADPYNIYAVLQYTKGLAADKPTDNEVYFKGKVVSVTDNNNYGTEFGNATFYVSDDGTETNQFYVYRILYLGNKKYESGDKLKKGDEVVVCSRVVNYRGNTPETYCSTKEPTYNGYLVSLNNQNGGQTDPTPVTGPLGTEQNPASVATAIATGTAPQAWVKGYIVGYVDGMTYSTGCKFALEGETTIANTNILISDSQRQTDPTKCMPIQLPRGNIRSALNLAENPGLLGQEIVIYGELASYFSVPGIKNPSYAIVANQMEVGTNPNTSQAAARRRR